MIGAARQRERRDDGQISRGQERLNESRVDRDDLADKAKVLAVLAQGALRDQGAGVLAADAGRSYPECQEVAHDALVDAAAEDRLGDLEGRLTGHALAGDPDRGDSAPRQRGVDLRPPAVNQHDRFAVLPTPCQLGEEGVVLAGRGTGHRVPAVLDDESPSTALRTGSCIFMRHMHKYT